MRRGRSLLRTLAAPLPSVFLLMVAACSTSGSNPTSIDAIHTSDQHVETTQDGIDATEAERLAWAYFTGNLGHGCGFPELVTRHGNEWVLRTRIGYAGDPGPTIFINARNGSARHIDEPWEQKGPSE